MANFLEIRWYSDASRLMRKLFRQTKPEKVITYIFSFSRTVIDALFYWNKLRFMNFFKEENPIAAAGLMMVNMANMQTVRINKTAN